MLNIAVIPVVVFLFMFFVPILIAIFKGWKITLLFGTIFLVLNFIVVLAVSLFYVPLIFPLFEKLFLNNHMKEGTYRSIVSEYAKTSAVSIVTLILMPITMLLSWLVYRLFNFMPRIYSMLHDDRTIHTSDNEKEIVKPMNIRKHYLYGGLAGIANGLFFSSIAMSSTATIVTSYDKNYTFNKMMNGFTTAFTLGQSNYNSDFQYIYQWLPKGTPTYFNPIYEIYTAYTSASELNETLIDNFKNSELYSELYKNRNNDNISLFFTKNIAVNRKNIVQLKVIDDANQDQSIESVINVLEQSWSTEMFTGINGAAVNSLVGTLESLLLGYETSTYYMNWEAQKQVTKEASDLVVMRESTLRKAESDLNAAISKIANLQSRLSQLPALIIEAENNTQSKKDKMDEKYISLEAKRQNYDSALNDVANLSVQISILEEKIRDLEIEKNTKDISEAERNRIIEEIRVSKLELEGLQKNKSDAQGGLNKAQSELNKAQGEYDRASKDYNNENNNLGNLVAEKSTKEAELLIAINDKETNENLIAQLKGDGEESIKWAKENFQIQKEQLEIALSIKNEKQNHYNAIKKRFLDTFRNFIR